MRRLRCIVGSVPLLAVRLGRRINQPYALACVFGGHFVRTLAWTYLRGSVARRFPDRLIPMIVELAVYGFLSGLLRYVFLKNSKTNKFAAVLALIIAMVAGRVVAAFVSAIFLTLVTTNEVSYFVNLGISMLGKFTSTWVGIIIQLVLIPTILFALKRSGVLVRYTPTLEE